MYFKPASSIPIEDLVILVNKVFEGYGGSVASFTSETLPLWCRQHFIDLDRGYLFYEDSESAGSGDENPGNAPVAFATIAHRDDKPGHVRLVGMGCVTRGKGHGSRAMKIIEEQERQRGTRSIELECRNTNAAGMALYKRSGYKVFRELPGWETGVITEYEDDERLEEVDVSLVQGLVKEHASRDLAWQSWHFETQFPFANRGFKLGEAYCVIGNPEPAGAAKTSLTPPSGSSMEASTIKLATLFVLPSHRGQGQATRLATAVMGRLKGHKWVAPAIFPREFGEGIARKLGARELDTMLLQMRLTL